MLVHLDLTTADRWTALIGGFEILHGPVTSAIMTEAGHASGTVGPDDAPGGGPEAPFVERRRQRSGELEANALEGQRLGEVRRLNCPGH